MGFSWFNTPKPAVEEIKIVEPELEDRAHPDMTDEQLAPKGDRPNPDGLTDDELLEALKDVRWRLRNLYFILDKDGNEIKFVPNAVQEKFYDDLWYRNVVPKARQRGFTTAVAILALDSAVFTPNFAGALINQDMPTALRIFREKIKFAYDRMPPLIRAMTALKKNNESELVFTNDASLYCAVSTRGGTLQFLHVSELGQISKKHPEKATEIQIGSLPSVDQRGIIILESTVESPAGIFPDMVRRARTHAQLGRALSRMQYRLHWASWWDAREYEADTDGVVISGEMNAYLERVEGEIARDPLNAATWDKIGRRLSLRKRAWYVLKLYEDFNGDHEKMKSQYPTTLDEACEVSSDGLWLGRQMAVARVQRRIMPLPHDPSKPVHFFWDIGRSDDNAVWCGQEDGPWMNWLKFYESSGEAYAYLINQMRTENPNWLWGQTWLPHDAKQRAAGAVILKTTVDMFEDLGVPNVDVVPRTLDLVEGGIEDLRAAMSLYRWDEVGCAEGVLHLDGYSKVWNDTMGLWTSIVQRNGHQHAADALRQHAQIRDEFSGSARRKAKRSGKASRNTNAMTA